MTDVLARLRDPAPPGQPRSTPRTTGGGWFRAFWRWHFFASFLVVPILLMLAVTGLIYLFRFQLEPMLHADLMKVDPAAGTGVFQPYLTQETRVEQAYPDAEIVSMAEPREEGRSTVFSIVTAAGKARDVYVDPYTPQVLGSLDPDTTLSGTAVRLHGELMAGPWGDHVIELAACWAIVMAITGYVLFARGWRARRKARASGRSAAKLRSRHAMIGSVVGIGLLYLVVSGLPWTGFWGEKVQAFASERGSSMWSADPGALSNPASTLDESLPHSHQTDVPWALGDSEVPTSDPASAEDGSVANLDTAVVVAEREGLRHPMTVALPGDDGGVYSVIGYAFDAPSDEKTVHVDQYGGSVVSTYGFDDYPLLAKVVSHGIGLHEGRSLGLWSFWGSALMCLAVIFMCVTGPLMWWRRRPRGAARSGAPRGRMPLRTTPGLVLLLVGLGVFLPYFGLSLLVVLALDQLVLRRVPALGRWFATT